MTNSYCGKNCEECTHRDLLECPGCKEGPGGTRPCQCELARCCRDKGLPHCGECTFYSACGKLPARNAIPVERLKAQEAEKEERAKLVQKSKLLGPWLWALFLLVIPSAIASFLTNHTIVQWMPSLYVPGQILNLLCAIVYSGILLRLSSESGRYRVSGICRLISAAATAALLLLPAGTEESWAFLLLLPAAVVALVGEYFEYAGHAALTEPVSTGLSQQWERLWKWYIGMFLALMGSLVLSLLLSFVGILLALAAAIGFGVVSIIKLVYLYRTAKLFKMLPESDWPAS